MNYKNNPEYNSYKAYRVDWSFLPEPALLMKDWIRSNLTAAFMSASESNQTSKFISKIVYANVSKSVNRSKKLFIHIPKNSGTSISKILYGRNLPHFTIQFYRHICPDLVENNESFAVIRNPVERFVSSCKFIMSGKTDVMMVDRWTMRKFKGCVNLMDFANRLAADSKLIDNCIPFHRQSSYVYDGGKIAVNRLFNMSSHSGIKKIESFLGQKLPIINKSNASLDISASDINFIQMLYKDDMDLYESLL